MLVPVDITYPLPVTMVKNQKHTEIYASELVRLRYGHPLWYPEPTAEDGEIKIGDVGYIQEGAFHRLFNATHGKGDVINKDGVPDGFVPLEMPRVHVQSDLVRSGDALCSESTAKKSVSMQGEVPMYAFSTFSVTCSDSCMKGCCERWRWVVLRGEREARSCAHAPGRRDTA